MAAPAHIKPRTIDVVPREAPAGVYCVHISADRRTHRLSFVDAYADAEALFAPAASRFTAEWRADSAGALLGAVRCGGLLVCSAVLLTDDQFEPGEVLARHRGLLNEDAGRLKLPRLLADYPMRPLLATFACRADLLPAGIGLVQRLLMSSAPRDLSPARPFC